MSLGRPMFLVYGNRLWKNRGAHGSSRLVSADRSWRRGANATYDGGTLTVRFRKAGVAAGDPATYNRMPLGSAAWVDRPLNDAEPSVLLQQMNPDDAASAIGVLRNEVRF